jgi:dienelactone hydrolase
MYNKIMKKLFLLFWLLSADIAYSQTSVNFTGRDAKFSTQLENSKAVGWNSEINISSMLYMPSSASSNNKVPAVIILHGSGGIREEREVFFAEQFVKKGYAALIVETYRSRNNSANITNVSALAQVSDAYSALDFLVHNDLIDKNKISTIGFSMGGYTGYFLTDNSLKLALTTTANTFAGHISFYQGCQMTFVEPNPTSAKFLTILGEKDDMVNIEDCVADFEHRKSKGASIEYHVLKGASHAWEFNTVKQFDSRAPNRKNCKMQIKKDGTLQWWSAQANSYVTCQTFGYTIGYDKVAQQQSQNIAFEFLKKLYD